MTSRNRILFMLVGSVPLILLAVFLLRGAVFAETVMVNEDFEEVINPECVYEAVEEPVYSSQFVAVRRKLRVETGEEFRIKVFVRNTGNTPWFSADSKCGGPIISLGTERNRNRKSALYSPNIRKEDNNWASATRIYLDQERVNPGEIASFTFWAEAGKEANVLKEYFSLTIDERARMQDSEFSFEVVVGDPEVNFDTLRKKMLFAGVSGSVLDINLEGEKTIKVKLSEQKMYLNLDGNDVQEFKISTGKASTPTPTGNYSIKLKQETRVGGEAPHYIMDNFMWFKDGGYGIHALPRLRTDGGRFWEEAKDHIGRPVSHGCIRLLPDDAKVAYEFTDLGTKVVIER